MHLRFDPGLLFHEGRAGLRIANGQCNVIDGQAMAARQDAPDFRAERCETVRVALHCLHPP